MTEKDLLYALRSKQQEIDQIMRRKLPVVVGRMAKDHFQDNFRLGGFQNRGLRKWPVTRRQTSGIAGTSSQYGPLLSSRNHLFASVKYVPGDYRVTVSNDLPYAPLHNWGGETNPTVTPRMRRFAWAMYYKNGGGKKGNKKNKETEGTQASFWKGLALTRKDKLKVKIPQRQFIGDSAELNDKINQRIETELTKTLNL